MLATCIMCLNGSLLDQLSFTIVYLHNLFTCTFGRINMSVCLSVCLSEYGIPSDFVRKSSASLQIKISAANVFDLVFISQL